MDILLLALQRGEDIIRETYDIAAGYYYCEMERRYYVCCFISLPSVSLATLRH